MVEKTDTNPSEIADLLNKWGIKGRCPMCDHNDWAVKTRAAYSRVYVSREAESDRDDPRTFYPAYWIHCNNCGFVAQFLRSVVDRSGNLDEKNEEAQE